MNTSLRKISANAAYMLLQGTTWTFYAICLCFSSNVLYHYGFSDSRISILLGIATALSFALQIVLAELVSKLPKLKVYGVLLTLGLLMLAGNLLMLIPGVHAWAAVAAFALACLILQMLPSFANAMGMAAIEKGSPTNYSLARGIGSLSYSVVAYLTGIAVRERGTGMVPAFGAVCAALFVAATVWYHVAAERGLPEGGMRRVQAGQGKGFLRAYPWFAGFLAGSVLLQFSHNLISNFMYQIMLTKQGGAGEQGVAASVSALVELPVMFFFPLLMRRMRCERWVRIAALGVIVKALGILLASTPAGVYAAMATQMIGYGLLTISSVNYAAMAVGRGESVRAQSYLGSTAAVGALLALSTGGVICQYLSVRAMVITSLVSAIAGAAVVLASVRDRKS